MKAVDTRNHLCLFEIDPITTKKLIIEYAKLCNLPHQELVSRKLLDEYEGRPLAFIKFLEPHLINDQFKAIRHGFFTLQISNIDLSGCVLTNCNFKRIDFIFVNFSRSILSRSHFTGHLKSCNFFFAQAMHCLFNSMVTSCNFDLANFANSTLDLNLTDKHTSMRNVNLSSATLTYQQDRPNNDFNGSIAIGETSRICSKHYQTLDCKVAKIINTETELYSQLVKLVDHKYDNSTLINPNNLFYAYKIALQLASPSNPGRQTQTARDISEKWRQVSSDLAQQFPLITKMPLELLPYKTMQAAKHILPLLRVTGACSWERHNGKLASIPSKIFAISPFLNDTIIERVIESFRGKHHLGESAADKEKLLYSLIYNACPLSTCEMQLVKTTSPSPQLSKPAIDSKIEKMDVLM